MARPTPLSGFPELLPEQRSVEQHVIDTLRRTFELHGFAGIETRSVEPLDQLLRKGDTSHEVYLLRRLHEESVDGHSGLGLHFDLTVPFARYVLENAGKLEFPFRRYQVQRAWRGERPQVGRYREFTQADVDIVGRDELALPPRRRGDAGDGRGAGGAADPAGVLPVQQPQADPGLLPRPRHRGRHRARSGSSTSSTSSRPTRSRPSSSRRRAPPRSRPSGASSSRPSGSPTPPSSTRSGRSASRTSSSRPACPSSPRSSKGARAPEASGWAWRPTCASPVASTTTPAPWSRSTWPATSS